MENRKNIQSKEMRCKKKKRNFCEVKTDFFTRDTHKINNCTRGENEKILHVKSPRFSV